MGSLFKARDYWSVRIASNEEFDYGLFTTFSDNEGLKMVVGSHQGVLRIYTAKKKGYKPDDLLAEHVLGVPILQIGVGNFGTREVSLVILTPRRVLMASLTQLRQTGGAAGDGSDPLGKNQTLSWDHEHVLEHTAYNMVIGQFGGSGQDQICVQSMDGQLAFFTANKLSFARYLPSSTFLCPGRLLYVPAIDGFLTCSSTFEVQCYRFSTLTQGTASETKDSEQLGRKVTADWTLNIGEDVTDMCYARLTKGLPNQQVDLVILGEHTVFLLRQDTGEVRWNKRLDCHPSCIFPYLLPDKRTHNLIIGTHDNQLLIMNDKQLLWSAKTNDVPIAVSVGHACKTDGMILMLSMNGTLSANYLGTDPASDPVQLLESKEFDYEAMDEEQRRLQQVIRQAVNSTKTEPRETVHISCDPPSIEYRRAQVVANFIYRGSDDIENVVVTVNVHDPIVTEQTTQVIQYLPRGESLPVPINFSLSPEAEKITPTSLIVDIHACYQAPTGEALTSKTSVILPLPLVGTPCPPLKSNAYVVQIDTDQPAPALNELFHDLGGGDIQPNLLSMTYANGADVTVIASKNGGRYRVQGSAFESLWIMSSELTRRLKSYYRERGVDLKIQCPDEIPARLQTAYFPIIDAHFAARQHSQQVQQELGELAHQFRAIQKRLLVRFRDKNPAPLTSLETLFQHTYSRLHQAAERVEEAQRHLSLVSNALACSTHMMVFLTRYHYEHLTKEDIDVFRHHLSPIISHSSTMGWEEITDASMTHLLRTALSKSAKESASAPAPLTTPEDTTKLKKHLIIVFDRIGKGSTLKEASKKDNVTIAEGKKRKKAEGQ